MVFLGAGGSWKGRSLRVDGSEVYVCIGKIAEVSALEFLCLSLSLSVSLSVCLSVYIYIYVCMYIYISYSYQVDGNNHINQYAYTYICEIRLGVYRQIKASR